MKNLLLISLALGVSTFARAQAPATSAQAEPSASPSPALSVNQNGTAQAERVTVTGGAIEQSETDTAEPVTILNENNLKENAAPTLGDTLRAQPGVAASGFTAGASRPIIRGQADNRVRVLNNGTEVFDVSNLSPDHAPSVSALLSQSVEVVRGPATILFGSGAIGGVVNVTDNLIPVEQPSTKLSGEFDGRFDSSDLERSGAGALTLSPFQHWVFHVQGSYLRTDDRRIPGYALDDRIRAELRPEQRYNGFGGDPHGEAENTYVKTTDAGIGGSYVWDKGYIGASFSDYRSVYGVPDDPEVDDPAEPPTRVRLDVRKEQFNARSSIIDPLPWFTNMNIKFVYTDYKHDEIDGADNVGATFKTNGVDSRLELVDKPSGPFSGSIGMQGFYKELSILGEEAFLQPSETTQIAGFVFEEVKLGDQVRVQAGGRIEHQSVSIDSTDPTLTSITSPDQADQDFLPVSAALGAIWDFAPGWQLAVNGNYSQRAPTAEELFARGPHDATFQFIVGDPALDVEKNIGIDVNLRKTAGPIHGSLSGFYNHYDGFIDFTPTADFEDGLRVFIYTPKRAEFFGGEAKVDFHLLPEQLTRTALSDNDPKSVKSVITGATAEPEKNPNDIFLRFQGDYVHATDLDTGNPLPRITPLRYSASINYDGEHWSGSIEGQRVNRQYRAAEFETSTPGYTFLNANLGYKFRVGATYNYVYLRGTNLLDEEARDHTSFLKEVLPLAGRGVVVGLRTTF